jgi:ATP/maltotriose-dependent transcriptional regulator MalT
VCLIAQRDVVPALAGWVRANTDPRASREVMIAMRQHGLEVRSEFFYELMGEMESIVCEGQACYCRLPQLRNEAVKGVRKTFRNRKDEVSLQSVAEEVPDSSIEVEERAIGRTCRDSLLIEARRRLAKRELQVFELLISGASYAEISEALNVAVGTVGAVISRIRKKLEDLK